MLGHPPIVAVIDSGAGEPLGTTWRRHASRYGPETGNVRSCDGLAWHALKSDGADVEVFEEEITPDITGWGVSTSRMGGRNG
jgi:hypothetical protein